MSATVGFKRWEPVETETDGQVKQDITNVAANLTANSAATAVRLTFEKNSSSAGGSAPIARFYRHGKTPTASEGIPIYDGMTLDVFGRKDIRDMELISTDANTQTVYCQWIKTF